MSVIWNGVHAPAQLDENAVEEMRRKFRPGGSRLAIGLIGRFNRWKGQNLLMDAVDTLHGKGVSDFSVVFMGSPPPGQEVFEADLRQRIARSPARDRVFIQGFSKEIWSAYSALDVVCVPSTEPEPFGLVAVEAMAMGKPVLVSRFGGLTEIVEDGVTGMAFTPKNVDALAVALEKLLFDVALRSRLGLAGKERFNAVFSVGRMTERFGVAYVEMLGKAK